jgi:hypothetical protein
MMELHQLQYHLVKQKWQDFLLEEVEMVELEQAGLTMVVLGLVEEAHLFLYLFQKPPCHLVKFTH